MRLPPAPLAATAAGLGLALLSGGAQAGASGGSSSACGCLPTSHQVTVPGVTVVPPTTYIAQPHFFSGVGGGSEGDIGMGSSSSNSSSSSDVSVDVSGASSAQASSSALGASYAASVANAQAANLLAASGGGGVVVEGGGGVSGSITNLNVVEQTPAPAPQVCIAHAASAATVAVQAVCLDDKAVPHPASQLSPDRDVPATYQGELFRCVAGSHMQYVTAAWTGAAHFDHGQTVVCGKGEALWRSLDGRLQCRPQTPARDCNERSLLRRFGAGIKVVSVASAACTAYGPAPSGALAQAEAGGQAVSTGDFAMDGGVGR